MSDTVEIEISVDNWTEVQQGLDGLITNNTSNIVLIREAASQPAASVTVGHRLGALNAATYNQLGAGQKIFIRAISDEAPVVATVSVTED